ncbi:MAG: hypothetical protein PHU80_04910, partial [Kiritimatiellae bacterium]|nr:hypothetical protein [Kiritimatiellia bacterium]
MAKSEVIAIAVEKAGLRGVRFAPRGRDGWTRVAGGFWPFEQPKAAEAEEAAESGELLEADRPMARTALTARSALGGRQIVLSLPLSRMLVRVLRLPVDIKDDLASAVELQMDKLSPFPGE